MAPLLSSTPPPILPHGGGRKRCTADGSAPLRRSAGGVGSSAMAGRIDVNADLGESFGAWTMGGDEELMGLVSSANVACGFHAGDPVVMDRTVARAVRAGVALGAHPSHFDLRGFGRREIAASPHEVEADVIYQVGALAAFARSHGARLVHVKPHGALYNQAAVDQALAGAIARATARVDRELVLVGLASSATMRRAAEEATGWLEAPACLLAWRFGEESQQRVPPQVWQVRRCTHELPVFTHCSHSRRFAFLTSLTLSMWAHAPSAAISDAPSGAYADP